MKEISDSKFGVLKSPDSFEELSDLIWNFRPGTDPFRARMWRGQSNIEWPIHSSAFRKLLLSHRMPKERDLQFYELDLLKHATHRGYRRHDGRDLTDMELLAKLQHHGAATRLVDATRNAFVALWFAISADEDKTGILLGAHTSHLAGYEGEPEERKYEEIIKECVDNKNTFTWEPTSVTNRVAAQHSQFLYSSVGVFCRITHFRISPQVSSCE